MHNLFDHLVFRAGIEPGAVAIQALNRRITFARLLERARRIAGMLRQAGVRPGQLVVTAIPDKALDWAVTLALFHEGAVTCANHGYQPWAASFRYDWMVTDQPGRFPRVNNLIPIERSILSEAPAPLAEAQPAVYASDDSVVRVVLTSGTTGRPKGIPLTIAQLRSRAVAGMTLRGPYNAISLLGLSTAGDFNATLICLMTGLPIFVGNSTERALALIRKFSIDCVYGSPAPVGALLDAIVASGEPVACVKAVRLVGASPSRALVARIHADLCRNVYNLYGSTETGGICVFKPTPDTLATVAGRPQFDAQVQIVDPAGNVLPQGEAGAIRVRTTHMASAYLDAPDDTARVFRDGWCYPGDQGLFNKDGILMLRGRDTDVLNLSGMKLDPVEIDHFIAEYPGVRDAAVFTVLKAGVERLAGAVVADDDVDLQKLHAMVRRKFGPALSPIGYVRLPDIPRNAMGKVMRQQLQEGYFARVRSA